MADSKPFCVFCSKKSGTLRSCTVDTLAKCKNVLNIRQKHQLYMNEVRLPADVSPIALYHSQCYRLFTALPKKCRAVKNDESLSEASAGPSSSHESTSCSTSEPSSRSILDPEGEITEEISDQVDQKIPEGEPIAHTPETCIICTKRRKKFKGHEQALSALEETSISFLKNYAVGNDDHDLLARLNEKESSKEIVMHHRLCMVSIRNQTKLMETEKQPKTQWHKSRDAHKSAYEEVCQFVTKEVITRRQSYFLTYLDDMYTQHLKKINPENTSFESFNLESRLLQSFSRQIAIVTMNRRKIVKPFDGHLVKNNFENIEKNDILNRAALILRSEIENIEQKHLSTITANTMIAGECEVPEIFSDFFSNVISTTKRRQRSSYKQRLSNSFSEDLIYAVTNGKIEPSKHITLGMALKSLTNSKKIINIINRLGHCCSYTVLEELETEATFASVSHSEICPEDIIRTSNLNAGLAFNNFDRFVDTTSGKDTLHDTVGIIFQDVIDNPQECQGNQDTSSSGTACENQELSHLRRKRLRSLDAVTPELPAYNKKPRLAEKLENYDSPLRLSDKSILEQYEKIDLTWMISHLLKIQNVPAWVGYNSMIIDDRSCQQKISYLTTINSSPTNNSVVVETMKQSKKAATELGKPYMEVTYDLAIAKIALQIQSIERPQFDNLFIHIGSFHIAMAYFKAIGKFIDGCGITDSMVNSEILASGSVNSFLTGKHFNRCKRLHPIVSLALQMLQFESFLAASNISYEQLETEVKNYIIQFNSSKSINPTVTNEKCLRILQKYEKYLQETLAGEHGKTPQFCMIYASLVDDYFMLNRSIRLGRFDLFKYMLPRISSMFFTFNQQNYSRYLVLYHEKLLKVEETHPGLQLQLQQGSFGVKRTDKSFSRQAIDLTLEQTINADAANKLTGISHLTYSIAARQRWCKSHSIRSTIITHVMDRMGLRKSEDITADLESSRIKKHGQQLQTLISHIKQNVNPFSESVNKQCLYNISTGRAVNEKIEHFLLNVRNLGEEQQEKFIRECSEDNLRFEKAIKKHKITTFVDAVEKRKMVVNGKLLEVKMQRDLFGKLLRMSLESILNIGIVLSYPLTPIPLALCHADGAICKTEKSVLTHLLEKEVQSTEPEKCDVIIYDGFFMIHSLRDIPVSFGNISKKILLHLMNTNAKTVIIAFDRYFSPSIKDNEHLMRGRIEGVRFVINGPDQKRSSSFTNDLQNIHFKDALVKFLCDDWENDHLAPFISGKILYVNYEKCYKYEVFYDKVIRTEESHSTCQDHEEADTKIIFHVCKLDFDAHVTIRCSDTDVLVIMLGNMDALQNKLEISMLLGTGNSRRYINIAKLFEKLGGDLCKSLPGFHAFTGCDFNPAFFRRGKKRPFDLLKKSNRYIQAFIQLSQELHPNSHENFAVLEEFVCRMYGLNNINDVNLSRVAAFMKTYKVNRNEDILKVNKTFEGSTLPPCHSELQQQLLRSSYIAQLWTHACHQTPTHSTPTDYGWKEENNRYVFKWFEGDQLPSINSITNSIEDENDNIIDHLDETKSQDDDEDEDCDESGLEDSSDESSLGASDSDSEYEESE